MSNVLDAAMAEATTLQRGLAMIEHLGYPPVIIETDSYNGVIEVWSPFTSILIDCFVRSSRHGAIKVQHCNWGANLVAHNLARHAFDSNSSISWDCDPPSFIMPDVLNDVFLFV